MDMLLHFEALDEEEEDRKPLQETACKVPMDEEVKMVFLPCGHMVTSCPECNEHITGTAIVTD